MPPQGPNTEAVRRRNKEVVCRMLEAFNTGDANAVDELLHPAAKSRSRHALEPEMNAMMAVPRVRLEIAHGRRAFPDRRFEVDELIAEGDIVILHWRMTGTHRGPLFGRPPTGKKIVTYGFEVVRLQDGKIMEHKDDNITTLIDVLRQLGWLDEEMLKRVFAR